MWRHSLLLRRVHLKVSDAVVIRLKQENHRDPVDSAFLLCPHMPVISLTKQFLVSRCLPVTPHTPVPPRGPLNKYKNSRGGCYCDSRSCEHAHTCPVPPAISAQKGVWTHAGVRSFMTCPSSHDKRFKAFRCKKWKLRWLEAVHSHSDGAFIVRHKRDWGLSCRLTGVNTDTWKLTADRLPGFITGHNVITLS